jgi:hypothetical protein
MRFWRPSRLVFVLLPVVATAALWSDTLSSVPLSCLYDPAGRPILGLYGPYSMTREASGTSWQPEVAPHEGIHWTGGNWTYMVDGFANVGFDDQGGNRGDRQAFTTSMLMFAGERQFESDAVGFRTATTLEPLMGSNGYAELLQTGETGDGISPLIDRQHPHDLFMELALTENHQLTDNSSVFFYGGLPGEPALGPTAFMHRLSGQDNPMAPISHHWMDSTHITYGVLTTGYTWKEFKLEGSSFRGREPDQNHWNIESPKLDSYSGRLSYNPTENWSAQGSWGHIESPEQLFPSNNTNRATASVSYTRAWQDVWSATTLAWGRNWQQGIDTLDAALIESSLNIYRVHTFFTRMEYVQKDDLLPAVPLSSIVGFGRTVDYHPFFPPGTNSPFTLTVFGVEQFTLGYIYDFEQAYDVTWGIGASGSISFVPDALKPFYGNRPLSCTLFVRAKLGRNTTPRDREKAKTTLPSV